MLAFKTCVILVVTSFNIKAFKNYMYDMKYYKTL